MHLINLDTEQAAILLVALHATNDLMQARASRMDPGGVISNSVILQASKIAQIEIQVEQGALARWADLGDDAKARILSMALDLTATGDAMVLGAVYDALSAEILSQRVPADARGLRKRLE